MSGDKKILVIDDEESVAKVIQTYLAEDGYQVSFSLNGKSALEQIKKAKPALVLLDIRLGDMNGLDVLSEIKMIDRSIPVILVTGIYEDEQAQKAFEAGAADYITKPIDFYYLKNILQSQLQ